MDLTFPIKLGDETTTESKLYDNNEGGDHGYYPIGRNHFWHGGIHLTIPGKPLRAVADGEVIGYRLNDEPKEYKGPDPFGADAKDAKKYTFSSGFVLLRHKFKTPSEAEIEFYSLYMHLKPMTKEETEKEGDLTQPPNIFEKTLYEVYSDDDGGGLPIIDDDVQKSLGVIPFGSHFTVLEPDGHCKAERYRRVKLYHKKITGYAIFDPDAQTKVSLGVDKTQGRLHQDTVTPIYDGKMKKQAKSLPKNGFFELEKPDDLAKNSRFNRVAYPDPSHITKGWVLNPTAAASSEAVDAKVYHKAKVPLVMRSQTEDSDVGAIDAGGYFKLGDPKAHKPDWLSKPEYKGKPYVLVEYFTNVASGLAMVRNGAKNEVRKNGGDELPIYDDGHAGAGSIPSGAEYIFLTGPRSSDPKHWSNAQKLNKIEYPDPAAADAVVGYAFIRDGYDHTELPKTDPDTGKRYLWLTDSIKIVSPKDREVWANEILGEGDDRKPVALPAPAKGNAELTVYSLFEICPDSDIPAGHWSLKTGWRPVKYEAAARQGQPKLTLPAGGVGYAFLDTHTESDPADPPTEGEERYRLKTEWQKDGKTKNVKFQPPQNASLKYTSTGGRRDLLQIEKLTGNATRPWDGKYNGVAIHEEANEASPVIAVLAAGTGLKFKTDVKFKSVAGADGIHEWEPEKDSYPELPDGGFIRVYKGDLYHQPTVIKRSELPHPIEFNKIVKLATPIPIRKGDIVGYCGPYVDVPEVVHFEIFSAGKGFTTNPNRDAWGTSFYRIDPATTFYDRVAKKVDAKTSIELPVHTSLKILSRDVAEREKGKGPAYCNVEVLPVEGWLNETDLAPADPSKPTERTLAKDLDKLYDEHDTKTEKKTRKVTKDGKEVEEHYEEEVAIIDTSSNWHPIPGASGHKVEVKEHKNDIYRVRYEVNAGKKGWIEEATLEKACDPPKLDATIMGRWYTVKAKIQLLADDPAANYEFKAPEKDKEAAFKAKVNGLPRKKDIEKKEWIEITPNKTIRRKNPAGDEYVGIEVGKGDYVWAKDADVKKMSREYDWLDWKYLEEKDDPATPTDEGKFSKDGFCDLEILLNALDTEKEKDKDGKEMERRVTEKDIKEAFKKAGGIRDELRRVACSHPTEWAAKTDDEIKKWDRLKVAPFNMNKDNGKEEDYKKTIEQIKQLQWWDDVSPGGDAAAVWHFHPVGFVAHLRSLKYITRAELFHMCWKVGKLDKDLVIGLNDFFERYEINTPYRIGHFLSQALWECNFFNNLEEGTSEAEKTKWGKSYQGRADLKNFLPGDGRRFIGRGLVQLTGREKYEKFEKLIGEDLTSATSETDYANAAKVATPRLAFESAGLEWEEKHLNTVADKSAGGGADADVVREVTLGINGGVNHYGKRLQLFQRARRVLLRE